MIAMVSADVEEQFSFIGRAYNWHWTNVGRTITLVYTPGEEDGATYRVRRWRVLSYDDKGRAIVHERSVMHLRGEDLGAYFGAMAFLNLFQHGLAAELSVY